MFKKIILLAILVDFTGCCAHKKLQTSSAQYICYKVQEGNESYRYFLKDPSVCDHEGKDYICGTYSESGWLENKKVYINPKYITSVAEFDSVKDFQDSLSKPDSDD